MHPTLIDLPTKSRPDKGYEARKPTTGATTDRSGVVRSPNGLLGKRQLPVTASHDVRESRQRGRGRR